MGAGDVFAVHQLDSWILSAWILLAVLTVSILWALLRLREPAGPLSLFALFGVIFLIGFVFRGFDLVSGGPHHLRRAYDITTPGFPQVLTGSLLLAAIGFIALTLGHAIGPSRELLKDRLDAATQGLFSDSRAFWAVITVFSLIGALGLFLDLRGGRREFYPQALLSFGVAAAALLAVRWFTSPAERARTLLVWAAIATIIGGYGVLVGMKVIFLSLLLPVALGSHFFWRRLRWWHLILGLTIFAATFPFFYAVRNVGLTSSRLPDELKTYYALDRIAAPFLGREYGLDATMLAVDYVQAGNPYFYGRTFQTLPTFFVPRALWPQKPVSFGRVFNREVAKEGIFNPDTFLSPSVIGELYLILGVFAVFMGCLAIGMFQRLAQRTLLGVGQPTPVGLAMYSMLAIPLTQIVEGPVATHLEFAIINVIIMMLAAATAAAFPIAVSLIRSRVRVSMRARDAAD